MDGKAKQLRLVGRGKRPSEARQVNFFSCILFKGIKSYLQLSLFNLEFIFTRFIIFFYILENTLVQINSKLNLKLRDYL